MAGSLSSIAVGGAAHLEQGWQEDGDGDYRMIPSAFIRRLAEGLDVRLNQKVSQVEYAGPDGVRVRSSDGSVIRCAVVIIAVPLQVCFEG
jgi:L-2-hydroxyglutarate oxidase LhgO